jgi:hypothetical protein
MEGTQSPSSRDWGGGRLCRESPYFVLAPREGGALSQLPRTAACEGQADERIAKRSFYRNNIAVEDDNRNAGIYDPNTRRPLPHLLRGQCAPSYRSKPSAKYGFNVA